MKRVAAIARSLCGMRPDAPELDVLRGRPTDEPIARPLAHDRGGSLERCSARRAHTLDAIIAQAAHHLQCSFVRTQEVVFGTLPIRFLHAVFRAARNVEDHDIRLSQQSIDRAPVVMWAANCKLRFTSVRGGAVRPLGTVTRAAVGGSLIDHAQIGDDSGVILAVFDRALAGIGGDYHRTIDGRHFHTYVKPVRDRKNRVTGISGMAFDVTDEYRLMAEVQERLDYTVAHDVLTGLPNRRGLLSILATTLAKPRADGSLVAVLSIDLDGYDVINNTLGITAGDELVVCAAKRLRDWSVDGATVAHLGGGHFVVVVPAVAEASQADSIARCLGAAFDEPFAANGHEVYCALSIGIDCSRGTPATTKAIISNAHTAMLHAKSSGRNSVRFFVPEMRAAAADSIACEAELRRAIDNEGLAVHFQPIVTPAGRVVGVEALLRGPVWAGSAMLPERFIPVAEASGLIVQIGAWALRRACLEMHGIRQRYPAARLAFNISARQLHEPDFELMIRRTVTETGIDPRNLEIEITESVVMADINAALAVLGRLRSLGVRIALDDFGTGYSSLAYLKELPIDTLKIDRSFVRNVGEREPDGAMLQAILALAHSLGLRVVAEGVETEVQRTFLEDMGCDELQGYLFGHPVAAAELRATPARSSRRQRASAPVGHRESRGDARKVCDTPGL